MLTGAGTLCDRERRLGPRAPQTAWVRPGTSLAAAASMTSEKAPTNRYVDEARRDGDWQALPVPGSYR
jgi:hypothetical protein